MLLNKGAARAQDQKYNLIDTPKFKITELFLMRPTKTSKMVPLHRTKGAARAVDQNCL